MAASSHQYVPLSTSETANGDPRPRDEQSEPARPAFLWAAFGTLGAAVLLPFNALITPSSFYRALAPEDTSFVSSLVSVYNLCSIAGGLLAVWTTDNRRASIRIRLSSLALALGLAAMACMTRLAVPEHSSGVRGNILALTAGLSLTGAFLQTSVVGICAAFASAGEEEAMGSMLTGQGLVGLFLSLVQSAAAIQQVRRLESTTSQEDFLAAQRAAVSSFAVSSLLMTLSVAAFHWLATTESYRKSQDASVSPTDVSTRPIRSSLQELWTLQADIAGYSVALAWVFAVTLAIFPSLVSQVQSTSDSTSKGSWISHQVVFTAFSFTLFNGADVIGRFAPAFLPRLMIRSPSALYCASAVRTVLIPAFQHTNLRRKHLTATSSAFAQDGSFFCLLLVLGVSNGWLSSSIFVAGPASVSQASRRPIAAALLSWALTIGLSIGSLASYYL